MVKRQFGKTSKHQKCFKSVEQNLKYVFISSAYAIPVTHWYGFENVKLQTLSHRLRRKQLYLLKCLNSLKN